MAKDRVKRRLGDGGRGGAVTGAVALLLILCLAECVSEQRINGRGSKPHLLDKINGWRSQRGGSCLSYGHSCWGAHGKRSLNPPVTGPDWFLRKLIRRVDANNELDRRHINDFSAIFQVEAPDDSQANSVGKGKDGVPLDVEVNRQPVAKPMLDDDLLAKINLWQMMRETADEN